MAVTSQLTSLIDFSGSPTFAGYGGGQAASTNTDVFIEGTQSGGRRVDAATDKGFGGVFTSADLSGAGEHVKVWLFVTQWASVTQVQIRISSGADDDHELPTSEYPALGGFIPVWVDVSRAPESGGSANEASIGEIGVLIDIGDVGGNAQNLIVDEIMHGTSGLLWDGSSGGFADFRTYEDTNNEGNLVTLNGVDFCYSRLEIGSATATTFTDSGFTLIFPDQSLVADTFMGVTVDLQNASTSVDLSNATIQSANTASAGKRPDLTVTGTSGDLTLTNMNFLGLRTADLTSAVTIDGGILELVNLTQSNADILNATIRANTASGVALCDDPDFANLTNVTWAQAGSGHAIELASTGTYTFTSQFFNGFGADGTNSAAVYNNSGGSVTINIVDGGDTPTVRNGAGASTTINNAVSITLDGLVAGSRVYIENTTDSVVLFNEIEATTTFTDSVNYTADKALRIRVRNASTSTKYKAFETTGTLTSTGFSLTVNQELDE